MSDASAMQPNPNEQLVIDFLYLRRAIGILGIVLPIVMVLGVLILTNCNAVQPSISDYYYTRMGNGFVGILCAVALFLFCYKGYKKDWIASKLACFFALGVAFFPTTGPDKTNMCNYLGRNSSHATSLVHYISATSFFLTLAFFCLFLFVKSSGDITPEKIKRNRIYRFCGYTIIACIVLLAVYSLAIELNWTGISSALQGWKPIFVLETLALWAFGFSWLTKGEFILKDNS